MKPESDALRDSRERAGKWLANNQGVGGSHYEIDVDSLATLLAEAKREGLNEGLEMAQELIRERASYFTNETFKAVDLAASFEALLNDARRALKEPQDANTQGKPRHI